MLLPVDLRDWVAKDDIVHFIIEACNRLPLGHFKVNHRGTGARQYPPHMMLALLIYCYAHGIFSSRKIEKAARNLLPLRYLTGDTKPDHDTICAFRRENGPAFQAAFLKVLELAAELRVFKLGKISIDGTHIKAGASIDKNVTYERAKQLRELLRLEIEELERQAAEAEARGDEGDNDRLPEELARHRDLAEKMDAAMAELEERAKERDAQAQAEYEEKIAQREEKAKEAGRKPKGKTPKKPEPEDPAKCDKQSNLTDPDARIMRKNVRAGYTQSYNAQAAVDADGSQLIVGARISQSACDYGELEATVASVPQKLGQPTAVLSDAGFVNAEAFDRLQAKGIEVYCSVHRQDAHHERTHDFRPKKATERPVKQVTDPRLVAMRDKLRTPEGKATYALRNQTVETVFGIIKEAIGFRGFSLRGLDNVRTEWDLVTLTYNIKRLFNLKSHAEEREAEQKIPQFGQKCPNLGKTGAKSRQKGFQQQIGDIFSASGSFTAHSPNPTPA
jgi:transposase